MQKIPHMRQSDQKRNCGAACLAMLLQSYKQKGKVLEITECISQTLPNGQPSCRNNLILKYLQSRNIPSCIVAVCDIKATVPVLFENGIDAILSYRPDIDSDAAHFSVLTGYNEAHIFVNDPQKDPPDGVNCPISFDELQQKMKPREGSVLNEMTRPNVVILMSNPKKSVNLEDLPCGVPIFPCIEPMITSVLASDNCDGHWIDIQHNPPPPPL